MYSGNVRYGVPAILYIRYNGSWGNEDSFSEILLQNNYRIVAKMLQEY